MKHLAKLLFRMYRTQLFILQKMDYSSDGEARQEIRGYRNALEDEWANFNNRLNDEDAELPGVQQD